MKVMTFLVTVVVPDEVEDRYVHKDFQTFVEHEEEGLIDVTNCPTCVVTFKEL